MRVICIGLLAIGLAGCVTLIGSSSTFAKGLCTGSRECPETVAVADAAKAWSNCLFESAAVQIQKTQDQNSALEAALAACQTQEDGLIALLQAESNFTPTEAATVRPVLRAKAKSDMLEILRNGPLAERCRQALKEGRDKC
jgi:hypothetical protein